MPSISRVRHHLLREALYLLHPVRPARHDELERHVLDPHLAVWSERLYKLLRSTAQVTIILRHRLACHLDLAAACKLYLRWVASSFSGHTQDIVVPCPEFCRCDLYIVGEPRVTVLCRAPLGVDPFSPHPYRDARLLHRLGIESQVVESIELAVKIHMFLRPQARDDLQLLIGHPSPVLKRNA